MAKDLGIAKLHFTGDSQIAISLLQRLINGSPPDKVVRRWPLELIWVHIQSYLSFFDYLIIKHVDRKGNKVANLLENRGCELQG